MKLKINTSEAKTVEIELIESKNIRNKLVKKQKLGSQVVLPLISQILKKNKVKLQDLTEIEVNPGPGSFTGTRVGITVANTLRFLLNIPVNGKKGKIIKPIYSKSKFDK